MTTTTVRSKFAAFAARAEITPGQDVINGSVLSSDWILGSIEWDYDPQVIPNGEFTGALDEAPAMLGGLRPVLRMTMPLRGSGSAIVPPDWGTLMRCCACTEVTLPAAIGGPTAATAGTTTTVTGAAPFGTIAANQYRGQPLRVTGDQNFTTAIIGYTVGRVFSMGEARALALTTSSLLQIPPHTLYAPTSDESAYRTATIYAWADGYHWRFGGGVGTWSLTLDTAGVGTLTFEFRAQILSKTLASLPTGWNTTIRPQAPSFKNGRSQLNYATARSRRVTFNAGVGVVLPDNPEALEGFDPGVPVRRASGGTIDPLLDTALGTALYDNFRAGTNMPLFVQLGTTAGNRFMVTAPSIRAQNKRLTDRDGLMASEIPFACDGADSALYLCAY